MEIKNEEEFYNILYSKYKDYLYKLASTKRMLRDIGVKINFAMSKLSVYSVNLTANVNLYNFVLEIFLR